MPSYQTYPRRRGYKALFGALLACTLALSCADFVEYPLEEESVALLAPMDSLITQDTTVTFWWNTHQDARYYRLQVVSPSFDSIRSDIIDTVVILDKLSLTFPAGRYTWRVRPENDGSAGDFTYRTFQIKRP